MTIPFEDGLLGELELEGKGDPAMEELVVVLPVSVQVTLEVLSVVERMSPTASMASRVKLSCRDSPVDMLEVGLDRSGQSGGMRGNAIEVKRRRRTYIM